MGGLSPWETGAALCSGLGADPEPRAGPLEDGGRLTMTVSQ